MATHYSNLKIAQNAPDVIVRAAYKALSQQFHPDKHQNDSDKAKAERVMRIITEAHNVLSNPVTRKEYDEELLRQENLNQQNFSKPAEPEKESKSDKFKTPEEKPKKQEIYEDEPIKTEDNVNHHAWRRFFARIVDIYTLGFAWLFLIFITLNYLSVDMSAFIKALDNDIVAGWIMAFLWIPVESFLLSTFGTTPAKWLFGISVTTSDGNRLTFSQAFKRSFLVAIQGMSLGIITQAFAEHRLSKTGITLWDSNTGCIVSHKDWGKARGVSCTLVVVITVFCVSIVNQMTKNEYQNTFQQASYPTRKNNFNNQKVVDWSQYEFEKSASIKSTPEQTQAQEEAQQAIIIRYPVLLEMQKDPVKWAHAGKIYDAIIDNSVTAKWIEEQKIFKLNEFVTVDPLFYNSEDQFSLGESYEYGKDFPVDNTKAIYWYTKSAQQGNEKAKIALSRFNIAVP
jgi:curved DNA-binding protein CbpA